MRKKQCILLVILMLLITGCSNKLPDKYELGIIDTTEYGNRSLITYFDSDWNKVGETKHRYSNMSYCGFTNSCIQEGVLYLSPRGDSKKLDCGKIVALDLSTGDKKEYDFDRTNIIDFHVDDTGIYVVSNLNNISYLDKYDKNQNKIQTVEVPIDILDNVITVKGKVYSIATNMDTDSYDLYSFDMNKLNYTKVCNLDISESPGFCEVYQESIYFAVDTVLYVYNTEDNSLQEITLPHSNAFNLYRKDNILYVGYTDIHNSGTSYIGSVNLDSMKMEDVLIYDGSILQMEMDKNNRWFIMDYETISQYKCNSAGEWEVTNTMKLEPKSNYYSGGFFLKNAN